MAYSPVFLCSKICRLKFKNIQIKMAEQFSQNKIEAEIAELAKQIDAKRRVLEDQKGMIEDKEIVRQAVGEKINQNIPQVSPAAAGAPAKSAAKTGVTSYLDSVDEETEAEVNRLLQIVFSKGIDAAVSEAEKDDPFLMDAFHDALTDKVYDQLKAGGIVK